MNGLCSFSFLFSSPSLRLVASPGTQLKNNPHASALAPGLHSLFVPLSLSSSCHPQAMNNSPSSLVRPSAPQERLRIIQAGALTWRQSAGLRLSRLRVDAGADARRRCKCRSPVVAAGINRSSPRCSVCLRRVERGCLAAPPQRQARAARVCSIRLYSFCLY